MTLGNNILSKLRSIDNTIQITFQGMKPRDFIKFLLGPTMASIMTWVISMKLIEEYSRAAYAKETLMGIAIVFTIVYYIIGFCKMIPVNKDAQRLTK